jgi:hypothetical protein
MAIAVGLGAGFALVAPLGAHAATTTAKTTYAEGQFLGGTILGTDLDTIAALGSAVAKNNGTQSTQTSHDPLALSALGTRLVDQKNGVQLDLGQFLDAGVLSQYAKASNNGTSMAASGAISQDGGVGAGTVGTGTPGSLTLNLSKLLGASFADTVANATLDVQAAAAQANAAGKNASGKYALAGLKLNFTSPALAHLKSHITTALNPVKHALHSLDGSNGILAGTVGNASANVSPLLGTNVSVTAKINANLDAAIQPLLDGKYGNGAVSFSLETGAVSVDLAKLLGGTLNNKAVGTEVLSGPVVNEIIKGITDTVGTLADQIVTRIDRALRSAGVDIHATANVLTSRAPVVSRVCQPASGSGSGSNSGSGNGLGGLIGGVVGTVTGVVHSTVGGLLCTTTTRLLPKLDTSLSLNVKGSVSQIVRGTADQSNATVKVLGIPATINLNHLVDGLGAKLTDKLFDGTSATSSLTGSLQSKVVAPLVDGLLGNDSNSVQGVLGGVLSVKLNNQSTSGSGLFTETAVRVAVVPAAGGSGVATVDLAAASVGPNVTTVIDPGDPGDPGCTAAADCTTGDPGSPSNPANPGDPGSSVNPAAFNNLATTGVGIATLIAVILALLAAGAYLVREGYRRNSTGQ